MGERSSSARMIPCSWHTGLANLSTCAAKRCSSATPAGPLPPSGRALPNRSHSLSTSIARSSGAARQFVVPPADRKPADNLGARGQVGIPAAHGLPGAFVAQPLMTRPLPPKHLFVTGGVASSLGKGLTASSLGRLLKLRGLRVTMQKLDPYLNVDPGTMNPFQHGEVFVTDDGAETDLD